ncbi:MAG: hypothetical protein M0P64_03820 [Candidatus Pacebacteria bacterium]|jgi:uncharacterized membrane protein|nr:hypothetical protein [Candidatus Paceibacterota bacterium]
MIAQKKSKTQKKNDGLSLERVSRGATKWIGSIESLIVHTIIFASVISLPLFGISFDTVLLVLTTIVSLEAIYLAIFIQMTVNRNTAQLQEVEKDIEEISEDIEDIQEDVEEISEDIEDIQEDVEEISEDIEDIQEDVEEIQEEDEKEEEVEKKKNDIALEKLEKTLAELLKEIDKLKKK